jgi:hypothetical protein
MQLGVDPDVGLRQMGEIAVLLAAYFVPAGVRHSYAPSAIG